MGPTPLTLRGGKQKSIGEHLALGYGFVILLSSVAISCILYFAISQDLARTLKDFLTREFQVTVLQAEKEIMNRSAMTGFLARHTFALESPYQLGYAVFDAEGLVLTKSEGFREDEAVVEKIKQATFEELAAVKGMSKRAAEEIIRYFHGDSSMAHDVGGK